MKRLFDSAVSLAGVAVLLPVFGVVAVLIKLDSRGAVFHCGARVGRHGRPFRMLKFRTMVERADAIGGSSTAADDVRLTRVGRWLRRYKLDELPQLVNVLRGEMSLVGPRPQVAWAVALYSPEERALLSVRPGITDYASIRFSNEAEILRGSPDPDRDYLEKIAPEKIRLGLEYVRTRSFAVDLRILLATVVKVLGGAPERLLPALRAPGRSASSVHGHA